MLHISGKSSEPDHAPNAGLGMGDEICNGSQAESVICDPSSSGSTVFDMHDPTSDRIITSVNDSQNTQTEFSVVHPVGKMSIGHDDESEPGTSTKTGVLEPRNGHQGISYQKIPPATINEKIGNGSTVNSLTSPPLEQMKLSFNPKDGFETSKLSSQFPDGNRYHENIRDMFPSFQLVPVPDIPAHDVASDSDDNTFCRSSPYMSADCLSHC
ncbi:hypothetical protein V6N13_143684 [Hibiscus sabdariffa]|uniref:Uncharacterized protein n=1 Tax=Hibiscus sabdariffa TaxID=183260 RepID=A0ABR2FI35_9ROSI